MKRVLICLLCLAFLGLAMCKKKKKTDDEDTQITIEMSEGEDMKVSFTENKKSGDCDDFINDYEKWMERYIELLGKYKENPVGLASSPEYTSMSMEMMEWTSNWANLAVDCAQNEEYEKRFKEIQKKAEEQMEALGFN